MALDLALLESAHEKGFPPTLRFLRFQPAAITIGRFQDESEIDMDACAAHGVEVARRPTGGKAILHLDDFTYSLVMPASAHLPAGTLEAYELLSRGIVRAIGILGLEAQMKSNGDSSYKAGAACFAATTGADLRYKGRKLCGSAQVRSSGSVLQHGSILMRDRSELLFRLLSFETESSRRKAMEEYRSGCLALEEAGLDARWEEIADAFVRGFSDALGAEIAPGSLCPREIALWKALKKRGGVREDSRDTSDILLRHGFRPGVP